MHLVVQLRLWLLADLALLITQVVTFASSIAALDFHNVGLKTTFVGACAFRWFAALMAALALGLEIRLLVSRPVDEFHQRNDLLGFLRFLALLAFSMSFVLQCWVAGCVLQYGIGAVLGDPALIFGLLDIYIAGGAAFAGLCYWLVDSLPGHLPACAADSCRCLAEAAHCVYHAFCAPVPSSPPPHVPFVASAPHLSLPSPILVERHVAVLVSPAVQSLRSATAVSRR
jgi:hypothetical protein